MFDARRFRKSMHNTNAALSKLRPLQICLTSPKSLCANRCEQPIRRPSTQVKNVDSTFGISAECLRMSCLGATIGVTRRPRRQFERVPQVQHRWSSSKALLSHDEDKEPIYDPVGSSQKSKRTRYTAEEYLGLVDYYESFNDIVPSHRVSPLRSPKDDKPSEDISELEDEDVRLTIAALNRLLASQDSSPEDTFKAYRMLPEPGVKFLDKDQRNLLIRKLSVTEFKLPSRTVAFLSVLDDYRKADLSIPKHAWNSGMYLGSTTLSQITDVEIEFALRTWKEMEIQAGVRGDEVTFNILFNVASKVGKFSLAKMILQEMDARRLDYTRFTRVGLILYHGLRGDGENVRSSYREFVTAKEIVDTVALNCVISALILAGEPDAARAVFERMRSLSREREGAAIGFVPRSWEKRRELSRVFKNIAIQARVAAKKTSSGAGDPLTASIFRGVQDMISIAPDSRSCRILIRYYASAGRLHDCAEVLDVMQESNIPQIEAIFADLFRGFAAHGHRTYGDWTTERLRNTWSACETLLNRGDLVFNIQSKLMGIWAIVATRRCENYEAAMQVYETLKGLWQGEHTAFDDAVEKPFVRGRYLLDAQDEIWDLANDPQTERLPSKSLSDGEMQ